jgi:1,2-dihydroxy-3-keto-5-methylthiopentene dioxygenase
MSLLRIYPENDSSIHREYVSHGEIAFHLNAIGIRFEQWIADRDLATNATSEEILAAYDAPLKKLMKDGDFVTADVISVHTGMTNHAELRQKFINEHTHSEDEARFFVDGSGIFYIHTEKRIYAILCERGDFLNVPAGTKHWFDMGPQPFLKAIRTFKTPEGWVGNFTGSDIASRFPRFESIVSLPA